MSLLFSLQRSSTFVQEPQMHGGTLLKCECGWQGPLRSATYVEVHKRDGSVETCHYVCKNCFQVLTTEGQIEPPSLEDQANGTWKPIHKKESK